MLVELLDNQTDHMNVATAEKHDSTIDLSSRDSVLTRVKDALNTQREIVRTSKDGKTKKTIPLPPIGDKTLISARELWIYCVGKDKPINWIESYKALLKYVSKDYSHIFQPTVRGDKSGTRYYVKLDNVVDFLYKFENNKLNNKKTK